MGLSISISWAMFFVPLLYVILIMPSITEQIFSMGEVLEEKRQLEHFFINSNIELDSLLRETGSPRINFTLTNDGTEKLWDFKKFNLLIDYSGATGKKVEYLEYDGMCFGGIPAAGSWCIETISGIFESGIINEGENGIIRTQVNENLVNSNVIVVFCTDKGAISTLT